MGDSTRSIIKRRQVAQRAWRNFTHSRPSACPPTVLANYFIDRYAFRCHPAIRRRDTAHCSEQSAVIGDRATQLESLVRPSRRLDGWSPNPTAPTGVGSFYEELRGRWAQYCAARALGPVGDLPDAREQTWMQVMDNTVFYPGPPVFRGATFIDSLDCDSSNAVLRDVGRQGVIDFYCCMLQVHEHVHHHQTGEPLLNEIVQAGLWSNFLSTNSLSHFQQGTEGPLVREADVVARCPEFPAAAIDHNLDTAHAMHDVAADNAYFAACLLGYRFDQGYESYASYLEQLAALLGERPNKRSIRYRISRWL